MTGGYIFDQAWASELDRLRALEEVYDGWTRHRLSALGTADGWRCLEVGCGAGSIARWLAGRVGPGGEVLAIDLDPRFAVDHDLPNLEVRRHDLLADPLPADAFHLVHARAVLEHLSARQEAVRRMAEAARPGGWVVVEDFDIEGPMTAAVARYYPPEYAPLAERLGRALQATFAAGGVDAGFGRRLPGVLAEAGLRDVAAELHAPVLAGGSDRFFALTLRRLRERLVGTGIVTGGDIDEVIALTERPGARYVPNFMVIAWGRKSG